jgi:tryptophan synthase alpha chain
MRFRMRTVSGSTWPNLEGITIGVYLPDPDIFACAAFNSIESTVTNSGPVPGISHLSTDAKNSSKRVHFGVPLPIFITSVARLPAGLKRYPRWRMLSSMFAALREKGEKALVLFVTAGDPALDQLPAILSALVEGGADAIEVGIPFSDPIADGPTIQASSQRALDRGVTPSAVLETLEGFSAGVPVVLMGYYNPMLRIGLGEFAARSASAGALGSIVCDLTPEESDAWVEVAGANGIDNIYLAAPTSTDARLDEVCRRASGFVYALARTGVTGTVSRGEGDAPALVARLRSRTELPICVGFGLSRPDQVREVCQFADGAIVGSWLVDWLAQNWKNGDGRPELVQLIRELKESTRA